MRARPEAASGMINVTKTFLPPLEDYVRHLERVWASGWLTNNGEAVQQLERDLAAYLGVPHLLFLANGTLALQLAIKALDLHDEIITTPFSYVATSSSIVWEGCRPVFVDIDPRTLTLDARRIERAVTGRTTAILATHVYGIPCNVEAIVAIAARHRLRVIYDAAHAFGVRHRATSVLNFGDISTLSFHATKLFHTVEGGAVVTADPVLAHKLSYLRNFGHDGPESFQGLGINAKNSEFHAAMGLCVLPHVPKIIQDRRRISQRYDGHLSGAAPRIIRPEVPADTEYNYAYYPVIFETEHLLLATRAALVAQRIQPRRYFFPSLSELPYAEASEVPVSRDVSRRVLCLPLFAELSDPDVDLIAQVVLETVSATT
ncbi:MAG: DegT/DnrJ/EryC1/StrS family aminotransferase, partial [Gemmatimonadales bacterium]